MIDQVGNLTMNRVGFYQNPFFRMSNFFMPSDWKELMKYCEFYYQNDPLINAIINKTADYPVTSIIVEEADSEKIIDDYQRILYDMDINSVLSKIIKEYLIFGNSVGAFYSPFRRKLKCPKCGQENVFLETDFTYNNGIFNGKCNFCKVHGVEFEISDYYDTDETPNMVFFHVNNLKVEHNKFTGKNTFYDLIDAETKKKLNHTEDKDFLYTVPAHYFKAIKESKAVKFTHDNIWHAKNSEITCDLFPGMGMPLILPVLKTLYFKNLLRKTNEVIAIDKIAAKEYITAAQTSSDGVMAMGGSLAAFRLHIEQELKKYRNDPNYIGIFPTPVIFGKMGGDGKMYFTLQEEELLNQEIIEGMQVPMEFLKGGLSWSGSSVSLRMLENRFLNLRLTLDRFLNSFLVPKLMKSCNLPRVKLKQKDFKMADDIQKVQLEYQMMDSKRISETTFLANRGFDFSKELENIEKDERNKVKAVKAFAENQATVNTVTALEGAKAQIAAQKYQAELTLANKDGSHGPKDLYVTGSDYKDWKSKGERKGELIQAINSIEQNALDQMKVQMKAQQIQAGMQGEAASLVQNAQKHVQEREQPKQSDMIDGAIESLELMKKFEFIMSSPDDIIYNEKIDKFLSSVPPELQEDMLSRFQIFAIIHSLVYEGANIEEVYNMLQQNGYAVDDYVRKVTAYLTTKNIKVTIPDNQNSKVFNKPMATETTDMRPLPEQRPPRRENSSI